MTDTEEDMQLFDNAASTFPSKYDLKDRLVAIWVTGKHGTRPGSGGSKAYDWVETITLVLDNPKGVAAEDWDGLVKNEDGDMVESLVPAVNPGEPGRLDNFQYSQGGLAVRLKPRINLKDPKTGHPIYRPMIGRINERKSTQKGQNNPWSIAPATEDEMAYITQNFMEQIRAVTIEVKGMREGTGSDEAAFDA